jgi:hypothetical protein
MVADRASDPRAFTLETRFSVAGRVILDMRREALDVGNSDRTRYEERLEATFAAFLEVIGDHPLRYYVPLHLQDFATFMGNVNRRPKLTPYRHPILTPLVV